MTSAPWPQFLIVSSDVSRSSKFYCDVIGLESRHGGDEYDQLFAGDEMVMQLHDDEVDDHHGPLAEPGIKRGNGVLVWFEVEDFEGTVARAREAGAPVVREVEINPNARQSEFWFSDPDGYTVVVAGPSEYRPR